MQAKVAVSLKSGALEDSVPEVTGESVGLLGKEATDKKAKEKKKPLKMDFSAYCDCV